MQELSSVLKQFGLGESKKIFKLDRGKINKTFLVATEDAKKYILQQIKLIPSMADDTRLFQKIAEGWTEYRRIANEALSEECIRCGTPIRKISDDQFVFRWTNDELWRMFEYIDHDEPCQPNPKIAYEAGKALGMFHRRLGKSGYVPVFPIPDFHNTPKIIKKLEKIYSDNQEKAGRTKDEFWFVMNNVQSYYMTENQMRTIIHGDPKLENFLFKDGKVVGIIDLDTMMVGSIYLDIGDALRSWCNIGNIFQKDIFHASVEGYQEGSKTTLDTALALRFVKLITIELAARYLTDYFEESYFFWDRDRYASAAEHNLARTRDCLGYFATIDII